MGLCLVLPPAPAAAWEATPRLRVGLGTGVDSNPRRLAGEGTGSPDPMAAAVVLGALALTRGEEAATLQGEIGAQGFAHADGEDRLALRLSGAWRRHLAPRLAGSLVATYQDRFQRGVPATEEPADPEWACEVPRGEGVDQWRCGRRDYRRLEADAGLHWTPATGWQLAGRLGVGRHDYKPDPAFSWRGPRGEILGRRRLGDHHALEARLAVAWRHFPWGARFTLVEDGAGGWRPRSTGEARWERLWAIGAGWRLKGPVLVSLAWTTSRSVADGDALDVLRHRLVGTVGARLGPRLTLLASASLQLAHWPEGNALADVTPMAEEEQMSSLALKLTWRLFPPVSLVLEGQGQANEWVTRPDDVLPYRRWVARTGLELTLGPAR